MKSLNPFSLAASAPPKDIPSESLISKLIGARWIRDLGTVTTSPSGIADVTIVHRSSTLMPELYGKRFFFRQFLHVRNSLIGVAVHVGFLVGITLLMIPPIRALVRRFVFAPGQGPSSEASKHDRLEYHAVATADQEGPSPKRAFGKFSFDGGMYLLTGLLLAEAAIVILNNEEKVKKVSRGGIVTSATLGQDFVDRLEKVGCNIDTKTFQH